MLSAGDFFIGLYPPGSGKRRRILVLTPPHNGYVIVSFTSTLMNDNTVVLNPGDHPEVTRQCSVVFEQTELTPTAVVETAITRGALKRCVPLDAAVLQRIQEGLFESDDVSLDVIAFAKDLI